MLIYSNSYFFNKKWVLQHLQLSREVKQDWYFLGKILIDMAPLFQRCYILAGRKKTKIFFQYVFESVRWVNRRKMGNFELYSGTFYKRGNLLNQPTFWGSFNILRLPPPNLPKTLKATWAMLSCGFRSVFHRAWKIKRSIIKTFWYSGRTK